MASKTAALIGILMSNKSVKAVKVREDGKFERLGQVLQWQIGNNISKIKNIVLGDHEKGIKSLDHRGNIIYGSRLKNETFEFKNEHEFCNNARNCFTAKELQNEACIYLFNKNEKDRYWSFGWVWDKGMYAYLRSLVDELYKYRWSPCLKDNWYDKEIELDGDDVKRLIASRIGLKLAREVSYDGSKYHVLSVQALKKMLFNKTPSKRFNVEDIDVSQLTKFNKLFQNVDFNNYPELSKSVGKWDTSNIINLSTCFQGAKNIPSSIGNWDTSNVKDLSYCFNEAENIPSSIGNWDTSNVKSLHWCFKNTKGIPSSIGKWDVSNVTYMNCCFEGVENIPSSIGKWDVSNVRYIAFCFDDARIPKSIRNWDLSKAKTKSRIEVDEIMSRIED